MKSLTTVLLLVLMQVSLHQCSDTTTEITKNQEVVTGKNTKQAFSIAAKLKENEQLPIAERIALYHHLKAQTPNPYDFTNEEELARYGFDLLRDDRTVEAIEIFKLNTVQFPKSSDAIDNLAEAYLKNGDTLKALEKYQMALLVNPSDFNAEQQIKYLKGQK